MAPLYRGADVGDRQEETRGCLRGGSVEFSGGKCTGFPYCAHIGPLPLLPSGPGGVGGNMSRRTRHKIEFTTAT